MQDERDFASKRGRDAAQERGQRQMKAKRKRSEKNVTICMAVSVLLTIFNLFLGIKLQRDMDRMQEQVNKIDVSLALLQGERAVPAGGDALKKEGPGEGSGGESTGGKSSGTVSTGAVGSKGLNGSFDGIQVLCENSYGAQWGMDDVDRPKVRDSAEVLRRLVELGKDNELIAKIYKDSSRYPSKMLEALANNPEMADFVNGYTGSKTKASGGFSEDELSLEFPLFLQWDPRWGYVEYGDGSCIGLAGCGPTCLSMALYYLTGDEGITPDIVAAYSMDNGYYVSGAGTAWGLLTDLPFKYGVRVSEPERSEQTIKNALDQGKVVICSMGPGDFTAAGHFIVIYGYDKDGFMINDPNCVARSKKRWTYGKIAAQIKHVWVLGGEAAQEYQTVKKN